MAYFKLTLWREKTRLFRGSQDKPLWSPSEPRVRGSCRSRGLDSPEPAVTLPEADTGWGWVGAWGRRGASHGQRKRTDYRFLKNFEKCRTIWNTGTVRNLNTERLTDQEFLNKIDNEYSSPSFHWQEKVSFFPVFPAICILTFLLFNNYYQINKICRKHSIGETEITWHSSLFRLKNAQFMACISEFESFWLILVCVLLESYPYFQTT